jgi:hypothetical protein
MRTDGDKTAQACNLELSQLMIKQVFAPPHVHKLSAYERSKAIRSKMFLKQQLNPDGSPDAKNSTYTELEPYVRICVCCYYFNYIL